LNFDIAADGRCACDEKILAESTVLADFSPGADMAKVPDFCAGPDGAGLIDAGGFVSEVICHFIYLKPVLRMDVQIGPLKRVSHYGCHRQFESRVQLPASESLRR
jgi:hypothetical protein